MHIAIALGSGILFLVLFGTMFNNWVLGLVAGLFFAITNFIVFKPGPNRR